MENYLKNSPFPPTDLDYVEIYPFVIMNLTDEIRLCKKLISIKRSVNFIIIEYWDKLRYSRWYIDMEEAAHGHANGDLHRAARILGDRINVELAILFFGARKSTTTPLVISNADWRNFKAARY